MVTILAFIVLGGISYAATGGNFILGKSNSASSKTSLAAPIADKALAVTNNSTKAGATALGLNVASGHPPFKVNSGAKVTNLNADELDGQDVSNWNMTPVIHAEGPLPRQAFYPSSGGKLLIMASGSGYRPSSANGPGLIGMRVVVDGVVRGFAQVFTNERNSHKAFVSNTAVVSGLPAVAHTIGLQPMTDSACGTVNEGPKTYCTTTDGNDSFDVTVIEIP
jgi:hypothetical protein